MSRKKSVLDKLKSKQASRIIYACLYALCLGLTSCGLKTDPPNDEIKSGHTLPDKSISIGKTKKTVIDRSVQNAGPQYSDIQNSYFCKEGTHGQKSYSITPIQLKSTTAKLTWPANFVKNSIKKNGLVTIGYCAKSNYHSIALAGVSELRPERAFFAVNWNTVSLEDLETEYLTCQNKKFCPLNPSTSVILKKLRFNSDVFVVESIGLYRPPKQTNIIFIYISTAISTSEGREIVDYFQTQTAEGLSISIQSKIKNRQASNIDIEPIDIIFKELKSHLTSL